MTATRIVSTRTRQWMRPLLWLVIAAVVIGAVAFGVTDANARRAECFVTVYSDIVDGDAVGPRRVYICEGSTA